MNRYFDEVHAFIRTNDMFDRGESILIGFSGGPDSMFLVDALKSISQTYRYKWNIHLAHLNHKITDRADENEAFCRTTAKEYFDLPIHVRTVDIPELKASRKRRGISLEALGRRERYRLFADLCREELYAKLATGHQLDDQAETVLMRAIGGSWLTGLSGIPISRQLSRELKTQVVRPLLRTQRSQIDDYVKTNEIPFFEDASNLDRRYQRNRVRHMLLPMLIKEFNPAARRHLASLGFQAQELQVELQNLATGFFDPPSERSGQTIVRVSIEKLRGQGPLGQRYILRAALKAAGMPPRDVTHRRVERVRDLLSLERRGLVVRLSDETSVMLDDSDVIVTRTHTALEPEHIEVAEFEICRDGTWVAAVSNGETARVTAEMMAMPEGGHEALLLEKPPEVEYLDAEKVLFPLFVRGRKDGDRLRPLGLDGSRKLQDILTDAKVPRESRDLIPLICDSNGILWVLGHAISDGARLDDKTTQVLALTAIDRAGTSDASGLMPYTED